MSLTWSALGITVAINAVLTAIWVLLYCGFSVQAANARIYFTRWFVLDDDEASQKYEGSGGQKGPTMFSHIATWIPKALALDEKELVRHAGLDMVMYLRMYLMAMKIFVPITIVGCAVLIPIYLSKGTLSSISTAAGASKTLANLTAANLATKSDLFWVLAALGWIFNLWALAVMGLEFKSAAELRMWYFKDLQKKANQFSVLVREVPAVHYSEVPAEAEKFFSELYPSTYLLTQPVYDVKGLPKLGPKLEYKSNRLEACKITAEKTGKRPTASKTCCGPKVDAIELLEEETTELDAKIREQQEQILTDPKSIVPAAFVSFNSRRGAAMAAQTLQFSDPGKWVTIWAPEPEDVFWPNLGVPCLQIPVRRIVAGFVVAAIVLLFMIPVTAIQGFTNLATLEKYAPWLTPVLNIPFVNAFLQGFLPGLAMLIFMLVLPPILLAISRAEGYVAVSEIDRAAAGKFFYFKVVTVFFGNVVAGSLISQLPKYISDPSMIASTLGTAIPGTYTFFISLTMIGGWVGIAAELFRGVVTILLFHIKTKLLVVTPEDRVKAMASPSPDYFTWVPDMEMYFLFSFMFMIVSPFYMPFVLIFYFWGYVVYRNQFINVYSPAYDLRGGYWPHFHARAIMCLLLSQVVLIAVIALKQTIGPAIVLIPVPIITILVNNSFIFSRYGAVFDKIPIDDASKKDKADAEAGVDPRTFLEGAYLHPSLVALPEKDAEKGKASAGEADAPLDKVDETAEAVLLP